jgi:hypothetical protein
MIPGPAVGQRTRILWIAGLSFGLCAIAGALLVITHNLIVVGTIGAIWLVLALRILTPAVRAMAFFTLLLLLPADYIPFLGDETRGFFVLGVGILLCATTFRPNSFPAFLRESWDILLLLFFITFSSLLHRESGLLRYLLYWAGAFFVYFWLHSEKSQSSETRTSILNAIVLAGTISGAVAVLEFPRLLDATQLTRWYEPHPSQFSPLLGNRSVGLSGHPLRLGTISMLSGLVSVCQILFTSLSRRQRALRALAAVVSMAALVVSGARGSWIAFGLALAMAFAMSLRSRLSRQHVRVLALGVAMVVLSVVTGLHTLVAERLVGSAAHPRSILQRIEALDVSAEVWIGSPIVGVGRGGVPDAVYGAGLTTINLENEYLAALLSSGFLGLGALLTVVFMRLRKAWTQTVAADRAISFALMLAVAVNIGTYNMFSWSAGPSLFVGIALLVAIGSPETLKTQAKTS